MDKKYDADVMAFMAELGKAADVREYLVGVYDVLMPALVDAYEDYLSRADPLDDAPTVYRLQHIISFGYPQERDQSTPAVKQSGRKPLEEMVYKEKWEKK